MSKYAKELTALLLAAGGALLTVLTSAGSFGAIDAKHWLLAGLAVLGSGALTAIVSNEGPHLYAKAAVAFLSAGFASLVIALNDNRITQVEWVTAAMAAVVAGAAVYQVTSGSGSSG